MTALIIDTSTEILHLGLSRHGELLTWKSAPHGNDLSKFLLPSIHTLLQEKELSPQDLSYIAIGTGPGSFTGTRVGAIVGMSFSFALEIPTVGFSSLLLQGDLFALAQDIHKSFEQKDHSLEITYTKTI